MNSSREIKGQNSQITSSTCIIHHCLTPENSDPTSLVTIIDNYCAPITSNSLQDLPNQIQQPTLKPNQRLAQNFVPNNHDTSNTLTPSFHAVTQVHKINKSAGACTYFLKQERSPTPTAEIMYQLEAANANMYVMLASPKTIPKTHSVHDSNGKCVGIISKKLEDFTAAADSPLSLADFTLSSLPSWQDVVNKLTGKIAESDMQTIASQHSNAPLLIHYPMTTYMYGCWYDHWKLTELSTTAHAELTSTLSHQPNSSITINRFSSEFYTEILNSNAHKPKNPYDAIIQKIKEQIALITNKYAVNDKKKQALENLINTIETNSTPQNFKTLLNTWKKNNNGNHFNTLADHRNYAYAFINKIYSLSTRNLNFLNMLEQEYGELIIPDNITPTTPDYDCVVIPTTHQPEDILANLLSHEDLQNFNTLKGLAEGITLSYIFEEDDCHTGNITKKGKRIDFDMSQWPLLYNFKNGGLINYFFRKPANNFEVSAQDLENLPNLKKANPFYWPTKPAPIIPETLLQQCPWLTASRNAFKTQDNDIYQRLATNPVFIYYKFVTLLKYILTYPSMYSNICKLNIDDSVAFNNTSIASHIGTRQGQRIQKIKEELIKLPAFVTFIKENGTTVLQGILRDFMQKNLITQKRSTKDPRYTQTHISLNRICRNYVDLCAQLKITCDDTKLFTNIQLD